MLAEPDLTRFTRGFGGQDQLSVLAADKACPVEQLARQGGQDFSFRLSMELGLCHKILQYRGSAKLVEGHFLLAFAFHGGVFTRRLRLRLVTLRHGLCVVPVLHSFYIVINEYVYRALQFFQYVAVAKGWQTPFGFFRGATLQDAVAAQR